MRGSLDDVSFRELVQNANTVVLRWDLQGCITFLNDFGLELFGYTSDELLGRSVIGTIVPEADTSGRDLVAMINELLAHPDQYIHNENENMHRDGRRLWITWRNRALRDGDGRIRELLSFGMDTTEHKRAVEALRDSERRYRVLFQSTPIAMVERDVSALSAHLDALHRDGITDIDSYLRDHPEALAACLSLVKVTDLNAAAIELFGTDDRDALERFSYIQDHPRFAEIVRAIITDLDSGEVVSQAAEGVIRTARGVQRHVLVRTTVVPGTETTISRVVTAMVDVTERKRAEEALRASEERYRFLAVHDNLTQLFNTRYLYDQLPALLTPEAGACALIFADLDHFKQVVDTYGHLNGSRVIQEVAETIRRSIAAPAFAVAYAGDEFVIVLPGASRHAGTAAAAKIRARLEAHEFLTEYGQPVRLSASFGVAAYPEDAADMHGLLAAADQALFAAKARGRNTVIAAVSGRR